MIYEFLNDCSSDLTNKLTEIIREQAILGNVHDYYKNKPLNLKGKSLFVDIDNQIVLGFAILENEKLNLIATNPKNIHTGVAERLIRHIQSKYDCLTARIDAIDEMPIRNLLEKCDFISDNKGKQVTWVSDRTLARLNQSR